MKLSQLRASYLLQDSVEDGSARGRIVETVCTALVGCSVTGPAHPEALLDVPVDLSSHPYLARGR